MSSQSASITQILFPELIQTGIFTEVNGADLYAIRGTSRAWRAAVDEWLRHLWNRIVFERQHDRPNGLNIFQRMITIQETYPTSSIMVLFKELHQQINQRTQLTFGVPRSMPTREDFARVEKELRLQQLWKAIISQHTGLGLPTNLTPDRIEAFLNDPTNEETLQRITTLTIDGPDIHDLSDALAKLTNLLEFSLISTSVTTLPLHLIPHVQVLTLIHTSIATLPLLPHVFKLHLENTLVQSIPPLERLDELTIIDHGIITIPTIPHLTTLTITNAIPRISEQPALTQLHLERTYDCTELPPNCDALTSLSLCRTRIWELPATLIHLEDLQLVESQMTTLPPYLPELSTLAISFCPNIQKLSITTPRLTELAALHMPIPELPLGLGNSLEFVDMSHTALTASAVILGLRHCPYIRTCLLSETPIMHDHTQIQAVAQAFPHLFRTVTITGTSLFPTDTRFHVQSQPVHLSSQEMDDTLPWELLAPSATEGEWITLISKRFADSDDPLPTQVKFFVNGRPLQNMWILTEDATRLTIANNRIISQN